MTSPYPELAKHISDRIRRRLELDPREGNVIGNRPNDVAPAGVVFCRELAQTTTLPTNPFEEEQGKQRIYPCRMGLVFHAANRTGRFRFRIELDVWRRIDAGQEMEWAQIAGRGPVDSNRDSPRSVVEEGVLDLTTEETLNEGLRDLQRRLNATLAALASQATYALPGGKPVGPGWQAELEAEFRASDDPALPHVILVTLTNTTPLLAAKDRAAAVEHFFRTRLTADFTGCEDNVPLRPASRMEANNPRRLQLLVRGSALGACAWTDPDRPILQTTIVPQTVQHQMAQADNLPGTDVALLAKDPKRELARFVQSVKEGRQVWRDVEAELAGKMSPDQLAEFRKDEADFEEEVRRMELTLRALDEDKTVLQAFQCMFETLVEVNQARTTAGDAAPRRPIPQLRPFQLGYVLTAVPDIIARARARNAKDASWKAPADLIFFPTGGGKTEAFQMLGVFTAFHDRLHGKEVGITAWLRFALRALTFEQTNRLAETVHHAEVVRRRAGVGTEPFRLGLLVGGAYTPVEVSAGGSGDKSLRTVLENIRTNPTRYAIVSTCPVCYGPIQNRFDSRRWHLASFCPNPKCAAGELNVLLVDDEIRRRPCAFVVGTIDKITGVGLTRRFQPLMRSPALLCPVHGASAPKKGKTARCGLTTDGDDTCGQAMMPMATPEDWGPSMVVLDEVHLLEEELAAFTAQYESCLRHIQRSAGFPGPKTVLASATVAGFERHVRELVDDTPRLFPSRSPSQTKGFWYRRDMSVVQRHVMAVLPHGFTQEDTMMRVLQASLRIRKDLLDAQGSGRIDLLFNPGRFNIQAWDDASRRSALRPYWTNFVYVLARHAGEAIKSSVDDQLNSMLRDAGIPEARAPDMISSEMDPADLSDTLRSLADADAQEPFDVAIATRSIAEGLDNPLLNLLLINGHPRAVSEDTQVNGRTGRRYCGSIVRVLHPIMERDRNHYELFWHYERNRDLLIEPNRINRRALRSIDRTMPGTLMALLFNSDMDRRNIASAHFPDDARAIVNNTNERQAIQQAVRQIYLVDETRFPLFSDEVLKQMDSAITLLQNPGGNAKWTNEKFHRRPMTSLRDIDPGIPFFFSKDRHGDIADRLQRSFRLGVGMTRSRSQVIFNHLPDSVYQFQGGSIVRTVGIRPDRNQYLLGSIDIRSLMPRLKHILTRDEYLRRIAHNDPDGSRLGRAIDLVRPGAVEFELFPLLFQCKRCAHHWRDYADRVQEKCPNCRAPVDHLNTLQFPWMGVHPNGSISPVLIMKCNGCGTTRPRTLDKSNKAGRGPSYWKWVCPCGETSQLMAFTEV